MFGINSALAAPQLFHYAWSRSRTLPRVMHTDVPSTLKARCGMWLESDLRAREETGCHSREFAHLLSQMAVTPPDAEAPLPREFDTRMPSLESSAVASILYMRGMEIPKICSTHNVSRSEVRRAIRVGLRCIELALRKQGYGVWPGRDARAASMGMMGDTYPWCAVTARVDGMRVYVSNHNAIVGPKGHCYNVQIVSNPMDMIIDVHVAEGNEHDLSVWRATAPRYEPWLPHELVLADAGYVGAQHAHLLSLNKTNPPHRPAQDLINQEISQRRNSTEHVHGQLKAALQSMQDRSLYGDPRLLIEATCRYHAYISVHNLPKCPLTTLMFRQRNPARQSGVPFCDSRDLEAAYASALFAPINEIN